MASSTAHPAPPGFVVEQVHPPQLLVLHSNSFVPAAWRARLGGLIDFSWTWTFALADTARAAPACCGPWARTEPWWLSVAYLSPRSSRPTTSWPTACWQASTAEQIATTTPDDLADGGGVIAGSGQTEGSPP
jgi:hypothetical protein